ncbi:MAG: sulfotransferase [Pseudomonadales bacterium]|nr:sulfotransferase [Pseudomonadales bacterium]
MESREILQGMKQPLIHVGYPKSLSSWMQKLLFVPENGFCKVLDPLAAQLFVIDPPPFNYSNDASCQYMQQQLDKYLPDAAKRADTVPVITSEALVGHTYCGGYNAKTNADRVYQLCPQGRVLIVVREQRSLMRSLYKTFITWGMPHSIDRLLNPVDANLSPQFNLDFMRFDSLVSYYRSLYGDDQVLVLPYEMFVTEPTVFLERLLHYAGVSNAAELIGKLPLTRRMNRNQTLLNLMIQRWLNAVFLSGPFNYAGLFPSTEERLKQRIRRSKKNPFPAFLDNCFEKQFASKVNKAFAGQFEQSNRQLVDLTGLDLARYGYAL